MPEARNAVVVTVSDRSAAGVRDDTSGPVAVAALHDAGWNCADAVVVADGADSVESVLRLALAGGTDLIVTTGGTGIAPRDQTPEGALRVIERQLPGIAEELRRKSTAEKPAGMLSRCVAGVAGRTLIVTLPGSPAAVASGMPVILAVAGHVAHQIAGEDHR